MTCGKFLSSTWSLSLKIFFFTHFYKLWILILFSIVKTVGSFFSKYFPLFLFYLEKFYLYFYLLNRRHFLVQSSYFCVRCIPQFYKLLVYGLFSEHRFYIFLRVLGCTLLWWWWFMRSNFHPFSVFIHKETFFLCLPFVRVLFY